MESKNILSKDEKNYKGLSMNQKIAIKKMFNEYLSECLKVMEYNEAVIFARHKVSQNLKTTSDILKLRK